MALKFEFLYRHWILHGRFSYRSIQFYTFRTIIIKQYLFHQYHNKIGNVFIYYLYIQLELYLSFGYILVFGRVLTFRKNWRFNIFRMTCVQFTMSRSRTLNTQILISDLRFLYVFLTSIYIIAAAPLTAWCLYRWEVPIAERADHQNVQAHYLKHMDI